jgi:hypothetical protein
VKRIEAALRRAGGELRAVLCGWVRREGEGRGVERGAAVPFIAQKGEGERRGGGGLGARRPAINGGGGRFGAASVTGRGRGGDGGG